MQDKSIWMRGLLSRALDCIYPPSCLGCGGELAFSKSWLACGDCLGKILRLDSSNSCPYCAEPLGPHAKVGQDCPSCRTRALRFTRAVSWAQWEEPLRSLVHALKFGGIHGVGRALGREMCIRVRGEDFASNLEAVCAVPLYRDRQHGRGYNQAEILAKEVARGLGLPLRLDLVKRIRDTLPQAKLSREERLRNPKGAFAPAGCKMPKRILLVDDVLTTCATVSECSAALREGGAERIYVLSAGR